MSPTFEITWIPLAQLRPAEWNANRVPTATLAKIRTSIETFGIVENLVVRPLEQHTRGLTAEAVADIPVTQPVPPPTTETVYEVVSGNHRLQLYRELGIDPAPCHITTLDTGMAIILGEALNHVRGNNDADAYNAAIRRALQTVDADQITGLINESRETLAKLMGHGDGDQPEERPKAWQSRYEVVIECAGEEQQQELYEELAARGLTCRVLTL